LHNAQNAACASACALALGVSRQQRVLILRGHERRPPGGKPGEVRLGHPPAGEVGMAEVADLAFVGQLLERADGLGQRCRRIGHVHLVQIDVLGLQPAQAALRGRPDVAP